MMKFAFKMKTPAGCCLVWLALLRLLDQILFRARSPIVSGSQTAQSHLSSARIVQSRAAASCSYARPLFPDVQGTRHFSLSAAARLETSIALINQAAMLR